MCEWGGVVNFTKICLRLPSTAEFAPPRYPVLTAGERESICAEFDFEQGKAVILAPEARSVQADYYRYLGRIAEELTEMGYKVFSNVTGKPISGTIPLRGNIEQTIKLAQLGGWVISIRSGLCDFLAFADCKLTVLYPNENEYDFYGFGKMSVTNPNIRERIADPKGKPLSAAELLKDFDSWKSITYSVSSRTGGLR
jgi:hypothetical protein